MASNTLPPAVRQTDSWIELFARIGYFAIGAVYIIAGGITAATALRNRANPTDRQEALAFILDKPFGKFVLIVMALGLAGYSLWRIVSGIVDSDRRGSDLKGWGARAGAILSGLLYAALMIEIIRLVRHRSSSGGQGDQSTEHWTARVLELPFGRWLVAAAGLGILVFGLYQLARAWNSDLSKRLRLGSLSTRAREIVVSISRFGIAARGVVFAIIGVSVVTAALRYDPEAASGLSDAFRTLLAQPFGQLLLAIVAIGFVAYGVYSIVNGIYRRIEAP